MIKLSSLINENGVELNRSAPINKDQFELLINSGEYDKAYHSNVNIYRGLSKKWGDRYFVKPSQFTRKSKNTINLYNSLLDFLPSWKDYPKRSKSIICSFREHEARFYGSVYKVIPRNDAKLGICPGRDFWNSFNEIEVRLDISNMNDFNTTLFEFIEHFRTSPKISFSQDALLSVFKSDNSDILKTGFLYNIGIDRHLEKDLHAHYKGNFLLYLDGLLNPVGNGFKLISVSDLNSISLNSYMESECWTDSDSILIKS